MSEKPLVSIITTIYNKVNYLQNCIESILKQTYQNIELILVEDASTDSCREIIKKYNSNNKVKIILNESNKGCYVSRNIAINNSKGQYIAFQDADDYSLSTRIEEQMNLILENNLLMCGCNMTRSHLPNINFKNDEEILAEYSKSKCNDTNPYKKCCKEYYGFPTLILDKKLFEDCGLYLENRKGMDMEFAERAVFKKTKHIFDDSWKFFNERIIIKDDIFKDIYLKHNKLLVISPQMNESNITNNIPDDDFLKNREWRKSYII